MENADGDLTAPTEAPAVEIKAIGKDAVHKICSGQVVLSLAVAVKELVENALDAGATAITVLLREQGLCGIEVADNGSGVEEQNLEAMTAKYHTSKLRDFVDLLGVETFGFRGEALSSLCALSDMCIITRHKSADLAISIELDHRGQVKKRTTCVRAVGTTVTLSNLFATLPVRKRDFVRNIKKEFRKMCQMLQAYLLVSTGVRFIVNNLTEGKTQAAVIMKTDGATDVLKNISAVFGKKQTDSVITLKTPFLDSSAPLTEDSLLAELPGEAADQQLEITAEDIKRLNDGQFKLQGYVSSCTHGAGRAAKDRQFFYINSRPCDPKNISKLVNDVYHRYNVNQVPFIYLNIKTPRAEVDVNMTPDKRQLLLHNEKLLLLVIKKALLNAFGSIPATFQMQNASIANMFQTQAALKDDDEQIDLENTAQNSMAHSKDSADLLPISTTQNFMNVLSQWKRTGSTSDTAHKCAPKRKIADEIDARTSKLKKIQDYLTLESKTGETLSSSYKSDDSETEQAEELQSHAASEKSIIVAAHLQEESAEFDALMQKPKKALDDSILLERIVCKTQTRTPSGTKTKLSFISSNIEQPSHNTSEEAAAANDDEDELELELTEMRANSPIIELDESDSDLEPKTSFNNMLDMRTSLSEIAFNLAAEHNLLQQQRQEAKLERLRFKSDICPSQNQNAEAELQREINKTDFQRMQILGQFNLGFIIVKLDTDLFIVDQHASDEKYNFECLQRTTVLQHQPLAVPQALHLTAVNELVLLDQLQVFEKNGFKFDINPNASPTKKVRLLGKPTSKNWEFGKEDIDELIFMLQDAPEGTICRPTRIRAMFASRACRKSVMIGKPLKRADMKNLIMHMGQIEQPWNCPHGRPTMRHLINLVMLQNDDEKND